MAPRSVTTWSRLEPRTRDRDMRDGLEAAVHDPLWLLGRQWQTGEFVGEDGGSLVDVELDLTVDRMARFRPGGGDDASHDTVYEYDDNEDTPTEPPLETLVERERVRPEAHDQAGKNVRLAAEAGSHFLRLLGEVAELSFDPADFQEDLLLDPTDADAEGEAYTSVVAGRAIDGDAVYDTYDHEDLASLRQAATGSDADELVPDGLDPSEPDDLSERDELAGFYDAVTTYRAWYRETYEEPAPDESAWRDRRLEYAFEVATGNDERETILSSAAYEGGRLDWFDFEVEDERSLLPSDADGADPVSRSEDRVPTPSRFKGMPAFRWWEIEDDGVDFSAVEAAPEDLARLLMLEFGLVYGNDWFTMPIDLPVGALAEVDELTLTTTFDETIDVETAADTDDDDETDWNMFAFELSDGDDEPARRGLFLPPVLASAIESDTVEEVTFGRDEMANVGWAIEERVEGTVGQARDRETETDLADADETPIATAEDAEAAYQLSTAVPSNWFPLLPRRTSLDAIVLDRGRLYGAEGLQANPLGELLADDFSIDEDELPRRGKTASRTYQRTRWTDGQTYLWSGRNVSAGRGRSDSGLAFDQLVDPRVGEEEPPIDEGDPYPEGEPISPDGELAVVTVSPETPGGPYENLTEEYVVFENAGGAWLDLSGWRVEDAAGHAFTFPPGTTVPPGESIRLRTGAGPDEIDTGELHWGSGAPIWNSTGDTISVYDETGDLVLRKSY